MIRDLDTWNERLDLLHETWKFYQHLGDTVEDDKLADRAFKAALHTSRLYLATAKQSPGPAGRYQQ